ncbi:MAG TPA: FixH family protein [Gammaproteobacteria bacterium]|nr:FixH family protein [Gammaproteobacteria bacterium]
MTAVATLLFCTACGQNSADTSATAQVSANGLSIAFKSLAQPAKGDNKVEALITQDGKPVTDASVQATFRMPAMPSMNMPEMHTTTPLAHQDGGRYLGTGQLSMAGTWNVTVTVARGGSELGSARFTLQAK